MNYLIQRHDVDNVVSILKAFANGMTIQKSCYTKAVMWEDIDASDGINIIPNLFRYRIKPGQIVRPFQTVDEVAPYLGRSIRIKRSDGSVSGVWQLVGATYDPEKKVLLEYGNGGFAGTLATTVFNGATFVDDGKPVGFVE